MNIEKFKNWLSAQGVEILPPTNEYEAIRFQGREVGVLYTSGKVSNSYTAQAIHCYKHNKAWDGKPVNTGRYGSYKKHKQKLLKRDGDCCFFCGLPLGDDITIEHLIALVNGGKNNLSNEVLAHEQCNNDVSNIPIVEKVKIAITNRIKLLLNATTGNNVSENNAHVGPDTNGMSMQEVPGAVSESAMLRDTSGH